MKNMFISRDWSVEERRALNASEIVSGLIKADGWSLSGDGDFVAIEKTFNFADYFETIAFVNALAFIAHRQEHHPDISVHYNHCVVRFSTHDVHGISATDLECAVQANALLMPLS